jgi:cardiolipin synthase
MSPAGKNTRQRNRIHNLLNKVINTMDLYLITVIALPLFELLGILAAMHAIMHARTSQGAAAWAIALVTLPFVTLILYAIFGRNKFNGYVRMRSQRDAAIGHLGTDIQREARRKKLVYDAASEDAQVLAALAGLPILGFNRSELLIDGEATFSRIFEDIAAARSYVLIQFYIVKDDRIGRRLQRLLIQMAGSGVRVYFLYDEIGSYKLPGEYLRTMERAGVHVSAFHSTRGRTNHFQLNFRNHRKIVVVDGAVALVGGHNVGDEYLSRSPRFGAWRDTHVRVRGPVVEEIQFCFVEDWHWATNQIPKLDWELRPCPSGEEAALVIASGPADPLETCGLMFAQAINMARERIWIASPYFVPDFQILGALKLAVLRGVDVRILLPEKPDHRTVHLATISYYPNTLPAGIKIYRYTAGFLHQKVFLVDDGCAAVGTANLDNRSFRLNFELTLLNFDRTFIQAVETMLAEDFARSRAVALGEFSERSFGFRLASRAARLLAPIL